MMRERFEPAIGNWQSILHEEDANLPLGMLDTEVAGEAVIEVHWGNLNDPGAKAPSDIRRPI
jgi:hypothetical protein